MWTFRNWLPLHFSVSKLGYVLPISLAFCRVQMRLPYTPFDIAGLLKHTWDYFKRSSLSLLTLQLLSFHTHLILLGCCWTRMIYTRSYQKRVVCPCLPYSCLLEVLCEKMTNVGHWPIPHLIWWTYIRRSNPLWIRVVGETFVLEVGSIRVSPGNH